MLLVASLLNIASAFTSVATGRRSTAVFQTNYPHQDFNRAVMCAQDPAGCDIDEMLLLADELEKYDQCFFESEMDEKACDKEKMDRMDVAELLRMESEVLLRGDYLVNANLFVEDVEQAQLKEKWDNDCQRMDAYSNY